MKYEINDGVIPRSVYELSSPRSDAETTALRRKIVTIARLFSSNSRMNVCPTATNNEPWACAIGPEASRYYEEYLRGERQDFHDVPLETFKPRTIYYTRNALQEHTLEEVLGVLRHELAHANQTDFRYLLEGQKVAEQEGYMPISWSNISNPLEDIWVNTREMRSSETIREQMEARYQARREDLESQFAHLPVNLQVGKNILYYWMTGKSSPTMTDQRAIAMFERMRPLIDRFMNGATAAENFELLKNEIWPLYRELEAAAQKDEQTQQMLNSLLGQKSSGQDQQGESQPSGQGQGQQSGNRESQSGSSSGEQPSGKETGAGQKQGLLKRLSQILKGEQAKPQQPAKQESGLTSPSSGGKPDQNLEKLLQQIVDPETLQQLQQEASQIHQQQGNQPIEHEQLSTDLRKKLEQAFEQLPEKIKQELIEKTKQQLEQEAIHEQQKEGMPSLLKFGKNKQTGRMEAQLNIATPKQDQQSQQEMQKLEQEEQQAEAQEAEQKRLEEAERERKLKEEQERQKKIREMKQDGFEENEETAYNTFRSLDNGVKRYVQNFIEKILPVLPKEIETYFEGLYASGKRLDTKALAKRLPLGDARVMKRKEVRFSEEARIYVELLIDNSGSMSGVKMQESVKTAIFFARVLSVLKVPFAIKLFGDSTLDLKKLVEDYDDPKFRIKPKMISETKANRGSTDIGTPLIEAHKEMIDARRQFPESQGMIFLITDGMANAGLTGQQLTEKAAEISKVFPIFIFGLGEGDNNFKRYLEGTFGEGRVIMPQTFSQLPGEAGRVLFVQMHRLLRHLQT